VSRHLHSGFLESAHAMPDRTALYVDGTTLTYRELRLRASTIAATLQQLDPGEPPLTAVFCDRSRTTFAGILGTLMAGHGYVPLNVSYPISRTQWMLERAGCRTLIVDNRAEIHLPALLDGCPGALRVVLPDRRHTEFLAHRWPRHTFVGAPDMLPAAVWRAPEFAPSAIAYLLFTSGSPGPSKGVGVTHANAVHFVNAMVERYGIQPDDRFSQMFETTFHLSVFDMFVAWQRGACVYCPSRATLRNPDRFIREHALSVWFSAPSMGLLMRRFGSLEADRYPSLRWSLFCGEPLPVTLAEAWASSAPASTLGNLYGPAELTVVCAAYRWDRVSSAAESQDGVVPIGIPTAGMLAKVVDDNLDEVDPGEIGELLMTGPQRTKGYWQDATDTERAHVRLAADDRVYFRTGDRVRRPWGDGALTYVGRLDHQIKVLDYRVELVEVEAALSQEPGVHGGGRGMAEH
jgi:amino acid adenylation domain-containing protein